jgi:hypothetical protein
MYSTWRSGTAKIAIYFFWKESISTWDEMDTVSAYLHRMVWAWVWVYFLLYDRWGLMDFRFGGDFHAVMDGR